MDSHRIVSQNSGSTFLVNCTYHFPKISGFFGDMWIQIFGKFGKIWKNVDPLFWWIALIIFLRFQDFSPTCESKFLANCTYHFPKSSWKHVDPRFWSKIHQNRVFFENDMWNLLFATFADFEINLPNSWDWRFHINPSDLLELRGSSDQIER